MSEKRGFSDQNNDPKAEFQAAVDALDEFNKLSEVSSKSSFSSLMRLVADRFFGKKQEDLLRKAIQTLKRNYALIPKLENGSAQEQTLASLARAVIHNFNANIDKAATSDIRSAKERIAAFLITNSILKEIGRIDLPLDSSVNFSSSIHSPYTAASSVKVSKLPQIHSTTSPLPKQQVPYLSGQAVQLFYMKVISLLEKHRILSHLEARNLIRNASLQTTLDPNLNVCIATCEMSPFPGQIITVTGIFDKDPKLPVYNIPSKEHKFRLAITSPQKGFPYPSQLGWALPDMIPEFPQRLNELPAFKALYQSKQALSQILYPSGSLLDKAKKQLESKRKAFNESRGAMIDVNQALSMAIIEASSEKMTGSLDPIRSFYARLKQIHHPYDYLSNTYLLINEMFFKRCNDKLQNAWFEGKLPEHGVSEACRQILNEETIKVQAELIQQLSSANSEMEKCTIDFVLFMGQHLLPWHEIILQQFSEIVSFTPPVLSFYLQKLQIICFRQFLAFEKELQTESADDLQQMTDNLNSDIKILKAASPEELAEWQPAVQIVEELKHYYSTSSLI
jgi:hypothetical protein